MTRPALHRFVRGSAVSALAAAGLAACSVDPATLPEATTKQYDEVRAVALACPAVRPAIRAVLARGRLTTDGYDRIGALYGHTLTTLHREHAAAEARHAVGLAPAPAPAACSAVFEQAPDGGRGRPIMGWAVRQADIRECERTAGIFLSCTD